jgi:RNA polymerase sigma-70 factor (ECF subfamily)
MADVNKSTSRTLLERARDRDERAWQTLVELYSPLVLRWCARQEVQGADADDIRQQVFQSVALNFDSFRHDRPGDTFRGWLRIITRNKLHDYFRRRAAQPQAQGGTDARRLLEQVAEPVLPDDTKEDLNALYHRALELVRGEFEPRSWTAFWKVAVEGRPTAEVAAELVMSTAAVRKAKSRIVMRLRAEIGDLIA